jgi:hypothetical protein
MARPQKTQLSFQFLSMSLLSYLFRSHHYQTGIDRSSHIKEEEAGMLSTMGDSPTLKRCLGFALLCLLGVCLRESVQRVCVCVSERASISKGGASMSFDLLSTVAKNESIYPSVLR